MELAGTSQDEDVGFLLRTSELHPFLERVWRARSQRVSSANTSTNRSSLSGGLSPLYTP